MIPHVLAEHVLAEALRPSDRASFLAEGVPIRALTWSPTGELSIIARDRVRFDGVSLDFARYLREEAGVLNAYTVPICNEVGDMVDLLAFRPGGPAASWLGQAIVGAENIHAPRADLGDALDVHQTVLRWLQAGRSGIVVLDCSRAAEALAGVTLRVDDPVFARRLRAGLTRAPRVIYAARDVEAQGRAA